MSGRANGRGSWLASLALVGLVTATARPARASGHAMNALSPENLSTGELIAAGAPLFVIPSEVGALVSAGGGHFALGWSGQLPFHEHQHHRVIGGLTLIPGGGSRELEARLGYRYAPGPLFGGLGVQLDGARPTWSPEIGVKLMPWENTSSSAGVHLLLRGEVAPAVNQFRTVTFLIGWTIL